MTPAREEAPTWVPSIYYAETLVISTLEKAWNILLDYQAWNPDFAGAHVTRVRGESRTEGELVLINNPPSDLEHGASQDFYAETVKVVPYRHIAWYVYPKEGESPRNFIDFELTEVSNGVKFAISYYEQNKLAGERLRQQRLEYDAAYGQLALAFKTYCETRA